MNNVISKMIKFFSPLIVNPETSLLSLGRFYFTLLLIFCCYFWFIVKVEVPSSLLQVLLIITSYLFASSGIKKAYNVGQNYISKKYNPIVDGKNTPEMNEFKVRSSEAAKADL